MSDEGINPKIKPSKSKDGTSSSGSNNTGGGWGSSLVSAVQKKRDAIFEGSDAKAAGKIWNVETRQYEFYFLDVEQIAVEAEIAKQKQEEIALGLS
jgi:hypothetical protein